MDIKNRVLEAELYFYVSRKGIFQKSGHRMSLKGGVCYMELKQNVIHRKYKKCEAKNQITIGDDFSVPEGKPDIAAILQKKGELQVEEVHTEKGKIKIRGTLKVSVFYLAERSTETANSLMMEIPFDETLYMEGAVSGDNLKIDWNIEELRVTIIHPGKLSVRGMVILCAEIMAVESHLITESVEEQTDVYTQTGSFQLAEPVIERRDSYRIRDEINLTVNKPNVQNILWKNQQLKGVDIRIQEGRLALKGEIQMLVVYQGEEDFSAVQWLEQTVPFQGSIDVTGLTAEMFGFIETEVSHQSIEVKPDYDGEMRMLQLEMMLEVHMHIFEERNCRYLIDAYSTKEQLNLRSEEVFYEKLCMCNQTKIKVNGQEKLNEEVQILQILGHQAGLTNKRWRLTEQGILCEGTLEVQVLYVTASDNQPFGNTVVSIPYSQMIEIPQMSKDDRVCITQKIDQIYVTMAESSQMEVRGTLGFEICIMQQCRLNNVKEISAHSYDMEDYKKRPGMCIHFVQPKETLWQIAKENRTTAEEIKKLNDLSHEEILPGQKLLLLKRVDTPLTL